MEVTWPGQRATVFVALAWTGRIPVPSRAGKDRKEPPPATALSTPARKAATISQTAGQWIADETTNRGIVPILRGGRQERGIGKTEIRPGVGRSGEQEVMVANCK